MTPSLGSGRRIPCRRGPHSPRLGVRPWDAPRVALGSPSSPASGRRETRPRGGVWARGWTGSGRFQPLARLRHAGSSVLAWEAPSPRRVRAGLLEGSPGGITCGQSTLVAPGYDQDGGSSPCGGR